MIEPRLGHDDGRQGIRHHAGRQFVLRPHIVVPSQYAAICRYARVRIGCGTRPQSSASIPAARSASGGIRPASHRVELHFRDHHPPGSLGVGRRLHPLEDGRTGIVRELNMRSTTLETFDGKDVMVPNERFIVTSVTNWTRKNKKQLSRRFPSGLPFQHQGAGRDHQARGGQSSPGHQRRRPADRGAAGLRDRQLRRFWHQHVRRVLDGGHRRWQEPRGW